MAALLIFFLAWLYYRVVRKVLKRVKPYWGKALVIVIALLIPTADAVYGRHKLKRLCAQEGGPHIYRVVEGVKGFESPSILLDKSWLGIGKYQFVEGEEYPGKYSRLSLRPDGTYLREVDISPQSEYAHKYIPGKIKDIYSKSEQRVYVRATGEVLGRYVNISYAGGWVERAINGLYAARGNSGICERRIMHREEFILKVLKPASVSAQEKTS
mgnify:CR=1 FL=1